MLQRRDNPYVAMDTAGQFPAPDGSVNTDEVLAKSSIGSQNGSQAPTA